MNAPLAPIAPTSEWSARFAQALHPIDQPPRDPGWNREELADLVDPDTVCAEAAVLVPVLDRLEPTVLLTRRHIGLSRHAGQIAFPGGRIDPDDKDIVDAALREAEEEVGLPRRLAEPLGYLDPLETITAFRVVPVVARVQPDFVPRPDPREVDAAFEVPLAYLLDRDRCVRIAADYLGRPRSYWEIRYGEHRIWGATAAILVNLHARLAALEAQ